MLSNRVHRHTSVYLCGCAFLLSLPAYILWLNLLRLPLNLLFGFSFRPRLSGTICQRSLEALPDFPVAGMLHSGVFLLLKYLFLFGMLYRLRFASLPLPFFLLCLLQAFLLLDVFHLLFFWLSSFTGLHQPLHLFLANSDAYTLSYKLSRQFMLLPFLLACTGFLALWRVQQIRKVKTVATLAVNIAGVALGLLLNGMALEALHWWLRN